MADFKEKNNYYDEKLTAEYNESLLRVMRIAESWNNCNNFRRKGLLRKWLTELDNIWDEIASVARETLGEEKYNYYLKLLLKCSKKIKENKNNKAELYFWIRRKHRIIKAIQDESGLGAKLKLHKKEGIL